MITDRFELEFDDVSFHVAVEIPEGFEPDSDYCGDALFMLIDGYGYQKPSYTFHSYDENTGESVELKATLEYAEGSLEALSWFAV